MSRFTADEEKEHRELEKWGNNFQMHHIERSSLDFSFSRSSGPGGQNVNKVSSKAQVKFRLDDADWIHNLVKKKIKENYSRYLTLNNEFTMQSEVHRTQEQNCEECVKKIYELIKECSVVPKETSAEQKKKVQKMIDIQKKKDIEFKKKLKEKKSDRRGGRE
jgi:peptidyl-tRNA hydrolase ICT1